MEKKKIEVYLIIVLLLASMLVIVHPIEKNFVTVKANNNVITNDLANINNIYTLLFQCKFA